MNMQFILVTFVLAILAIWSVFKGKLTVNAGILGFTLALLIYVAAGWLGIVLMGTFFLLGTMSTAIGLKHKKMAGLSANNEEVRTSGQVLANAGVAVVLGVFILIIPESKQVLLLMMASSFSAATADTLSSELGNVYGSKFINIISFKKDQRGLDGVVSLEGTLLGITGSVIIALIYYCYGGFGQSFFIIMLAGTIGNVGDSVLGATLERRGVLTNNQVNFLNTMVGAVAGFVLYSLIK